MSKANIDQSKIDDFIKRFRENEDNKEACDKIFEEVKSIYEPTGDFSYVWLQLILGSIKKNKDGMYYDEALELARRWHTLVAERTIPKLGDDTELIERFKDIFLKELGEYVDYIFGGRLIGNSDVSSQATPEEIEFLRSIPSWKDGVLGKVAKEIIEKGTPLDAKMDEFFSRVTESKVSQIQNGTYGK